MSQNVNVNLVPGNYPKEFHVSQYDVGRQLVANIVDSTGAYSIPSGATVTLVGTKPSGFGFTLSGSVGSGGVVTFSTTATVTAEYGRIPCELRITSGDTVLGTANLMLIVEESPHQEGVIDGNSETVIPELTILVERVEAAASNVLDMQVEADTLPAGSSATYSYDEETNTATFGIPQGEAGAGAAGVVAPAYSASSTYAVGDYVIHDGNLYRCTMAITTAEAFTAAHWTQVVLGDDVSDLKSALNHDEEFVGIHRSNPGVSNQRVAFYIPKGTEITVYTLNGDPFADSPAGQIQFFDSEQTTQLDYFTLKPEHGNKRTVTYAGNKDAYYFSVIPTDEAPNVAVIWYETDGIKEEKERLLQGLSDIGIEPDNLFNTKKYWTNNTAVTNNNDGTYTVGTSDFGRTYFGDEVFLEAGQYLLFASPSVGFPYIAPSSNINAVIVANYSSTSQIITLKESVTAKLCFRVSSTPSESFVIRPFLYKKTNAVDLSKYSALYSLKGNPILFPPSEPYKYTGEPITEQFLTGTGNLLTPLYSLYDALESEYSNYMTKEVIGYDQSGNFEMRCYTITQYEGVSNRPVILWISGIHASERYAHTSTYAFVKGLLENHDSDDVLGFIWRNCTLKVIPIANPWGLANGASRYNSRGVNLNRNFPCDWVYSDEEYSNSGSAPASEAETQNIMNFIKANPNALFAVNRHDSGTLATESGRMAYVVDAFKTDVNVLRAFFATMQNVIPNSYSWIVEGRPQSAYDIIFSTLSNDATPGMMDKWFNMYGTHGCLLEISRPDSSGYTADKQQDFLKINLEIVINMLASVLMQNQLIVSADDLWTKYPMPERS